MKAEARYVIDVSEPGDWDALVQRFPEYTVFHTLPWLETLAKVMKVKPRLLSAEADGACVGVWPVLEQRKLFLPIMGSPLPGWNTPYLGPLFAPEADVRAVLRAFLRHPALRHYAFFACRAIDRSRPVDLREFGFSPITRFETYLLSLEPDEKALWSNLESRCRSAIRKAQKIGMAVRREDDARFLDSFWDMALATFARKGLAPTYTKELLLEVWRTLRPAGAVHALSAHVQGANVATLILVSDSHTMYCLAGATDYDRARDTSSNNLIHWEAIRLARSKGLREYDFVSSLGRSGKFKRSFGPAPVNVATHWERCPNRLTLELRNVYERYLRRKRNIPAITLPPAPQPAEG